MTYTALSNALQRHITLFHVVSTRLTLTFFSKKFGSLESKGLPQDKEYERRNQE